MYHVCVCYHCFDSLLCILNLHTAGQFRILQYRFANTCDEERERRDEKSVRSFHEYSKLKAYIRQHQALILQKIGTSVQFNSIWTGVTFQLADVPRWISDTHGIFSDPSKVHYYFSIHRSCFINDRHNFDNPLLFFIPLKILPGRHPFRKTRHFRVSHNWLHLSTVDVHVQLRLLDKGEHGCSRCRVQLLVVVSADG